MAAIDAVIAWVDGNDPIHIEKRSRYISQDGKSAHREAIRGTRFRQSGEIYYCIASILKYAPFVRTIWVVTDNQKPEYLDEFARQGICAPDRIRIVDHRDILPDDPDVLPTFNSLVIEASLWKIPGLADQFIYFNDDFFLNRPQREEDWFRDGRPVLRSNVRRSSAVKIKTKIRRWLRRVTFRPPNTTPSFGKAQELASNIIGLVHTHWGVGHQPHPMLVSTQKHFFEGRPDIYDAQIRFRFRDLRQYLPASLANHIEITQNGVKPVPNEPIAYIQPRKFEPKHPAIDSIVNDSLRTGCVQSLDEAAPEMRALLIKVLNRKFSEYLPKQVLSAE